MASVIVRLSPGPFALLGVLQSPLQQVGHIQGSFGLAKWCHQNSQASPFPSMSFERGCDWLVLKERREMRSPAELAAQSPDAGTDPHGSLRHVNPKPTPNTKLRTSAHLNPSHFLELAPCWVPKTKRFTRLWLLWACFDPVLLRDPWRNLLMRATNRFLIKGPVEPSPSNEGAKTVPFFFVGGGGEICIPILLRDP